MELSDFIGLFLCAKNKELEQQVWEMWLAKLPWMNEEDFISYEEMLNAAKQKEVKENIPANGVYVDQIGL